MKFNINLYYFLFIFRIIFCPIPFVLIRTIGVGEYDVGLDVARDALQLAGYEIGIGDVFQDRLPVRSDYVDVADMAHPLD